MLPEAVRDAGGMLPRSMVACISPHGAERSEPALEGKMVRQGDPQYGTYRCPVCGHRDATELESGAQRVLACSYCETPLAVSTRGPESVRFAVQVAEEPARG